MSDYNKRCEVRLRVYEFIIEFKIDHNGNSPFYQEIADAFGWKSATTAYYHVSGLISDGKVVIGDDRKIHIVGGQWKNPEPIATIPDKNPNKKRKRSDLRTADIVQVLYKQQNGKCWWCGCDLMGIYEVDHRIAFSKDGSDGIGNLCLSCHDCNIKKGAKTPGEFNGRLL